MSGLYLGLDVGGTASRWALVDGDGTVVQRGALGGATGHLFAEGPRGDFVRMIDGVVVALGSVRPEAIFAGVTGLAPQAFAEARAIMGPRLGVGPETIGLDDDIALAYRAAFRPGEGHLVSAGTGSIGLHIAADGTVIRVGGRGLLIDDGGSGTWIALTAIDRLYRVIDAHGGPVGTETLAGAIAGAVGDEGWDAVRSYVYGSDRGRIGMLARAVAEAAGAGDGLALAVLADAGRELARLAGALIGRAGMRPVAVIGGVVRLHPVIAETLRGALPDTQIVFPEIDAAATAGRLARELVG